MTSLSILPFLLVALLRSTAATTDYWHQNSMNSSSLWWSDTVSASPPVALQGLKFSQDTTSAVDTQANKDVLNVLKIQSVSSAGPHYEPGWDFYMEDLNKGVGGRYIYVGYQRGTSHPVTSIDFKDYGTAQAATIAGWEWSPEDLNKGAGGRYIYMYWKRGEPGKKPIMDLMFIITQDKTPAKIPGWRQVGPDLNRGAGGPYIWAYYTTLDFESNDHILEER